MIRDPLLHPPLSLSRRIRAARFAARLAAWFFLLLAPLGARAGIWTPDPAKAGWGEDRIYEAYDAWMRDRPRDFLESAQHRMHELATAEPGGLMVRMIKEKDWDCSCTPVYIWVRFLYENRLPFVAHVYIADAAPAAGPPEINESDTSGIPNRPKGGYTAYTHNYSGFDRVPAGEVRFLYFAKLLQNETHVQDLSADLTYPIKLCALQGGVVNLSETHSRVIAGVDRANTDRYPLLLTGQWVYTSPWDSASAFSEMQKYQDERGFYGLRLFRVTIASGGGYRTLAPQEHKRYGGLEQFEIGGTDYIDRVFAANGRAWDKKLLIQHAGQMLAERIDYRRAYIDRHPSMSGSWSDETTQNSDMRLAGFCRLLSEAAGDKEMVAQLGPDSLEKARFPLHFPMQGNGSVHVDVPVRFFYETFQRCLARLSNPREGSRWLTGRDFFIQALNLPAPGRFETVAEICKATGETIDCTTLPPNQKTALRGMDSKLLAPVEPFLRRDGL